MQSSMYTVLGKVCIVVTYAWPLCILDIQPALFMMEVVSTLCIYECKTLLLEIVTFINLGR